MEVNVSRHKDRETNVCDQETVLVRHRQDCCYSQLGTSSVESLNLQTHTGADTSAAGVNWSTRLQHHLTDKEGGSSGDGL